MAPDRPCAPAPRADPRALARLWSVTWRAVCDSPRLVRGHPLGVLMNALDDTDGDRFGDLLAAGLTDGRTEDTTAGITARLLTGATPDPLALPGGRTDLDQWCRMLAWMRTDGAVGRPAHPLLRTGLAPGVGPYPVLDNDLIENILTATPGWAPVAADRRRERPPPSDPDGWMWIEWYRRAANPAELSLAPLVVGSSALRGDPDHTVFHINGPRERPTMVPDGWAARWPTVADTLTGVLLRRGLDPAGEPLAAWILLHSPRWGPVDPRIVRVACDTGPHHAAAVRGLAASGLIPARAGVPDGPDILLPATVAASWWAAWLRAPVRALTGGLRTLARLHLHGIGGDHR